MTLARSVDPVDVLLIAIPLLVYSLAFFGIFIASKIQERKRQASHKKRLDLLRGNSIDTP
jgi:uncharacterized membrane protein YqhA